jgi:hypothetical protein
VASGNFHHKGQLIGGAELSDQTGEGLTQVRDRTLRAVTLAIGPHARAELSMSTPHAVFVLLDGIGDMHGPGHLGWLLKEVTVVMVTPDGTARP